MEHTRLPAYLQEQRKARHLSMSELGRRANVSASAVRAYELGIRTPKQSTLDKIQAVFDATPQVRANTTEKTTVKMQKVAGVAGEEDGIKVVTMPIVDLSQDEVVYTWQGTELTKGDLSLIRTMISALVSTD